VRVEIKLFWFRIEDRSDRHLSKPDLARSSPLAPHAIFEQIEFHARNHAASTTPKEQCRRHMHLAAVIHAVLSLCYFFMVLVLEDDQLWGSVFLLGGINQFTINIGGVLTTRMWIYT